MNKDLEELDRVAGDMERKWGIGRLPTLVHVETKDKFFAQQALLDQAIKSGDEERISRLAQAMKRGWVQLDFLAGSNNALPSRARVWQARMPSGRVLAIVKDSSSYRDAPEGADVFTLAEIAHVVDGMPDLVKAAKQQFKGSKIIGVGAGSDVDMEVGDEIPF